MEKLGKTILILAADPDPESGRMPLRGGREIREIQEALARSGRTAEFEIVVRPALRPVDLRRAMSSLQPWIVHFCGHGDEESGGIVLENERGQPLPVTPDALTNFFKLSGERVECVVLNACSTEPLAEALASFIPHAVGMRRAIADGAATLFASSFYEEVFSGKDFEKAFGLACSQMEIRGLPSHSVPVIKRGPDHPRAVQLPGATHPLKAPLSYLTLSALEEREIVELTGSFQRDLAASESFDLHLQLGLIALHQPDYGTAERHFQRAVTLDSSDADAHYFLALSRIRGRRPKFLKMREMRSISAHIETAIQLDDSQAKYYYLLGVLKYAFYLQNDLPEGRPSHDELFLAAASRQYDPWEMDRLFRAVPLREKRLLAILRREPMHSPSLGRRL